MTIVERPMVDRVEKAQNGLCHPKINPIDSIALSPSYIKGIKWGQVFEPSLAFVSLTRPYLGMSVS